MSRPTVQILYTERRHFGAFTGIRQLVQHLDARALDVRIRPVMEGRAATFRWPWSSPHVRFVVEGVLHRGGRPWYGLTDLAAASAVAIPLALRARSGNAAALYAFCLTVVVAAVSGAGMGMLLGLFGPHQTTWYTPSSMTAEQYGYMCAMIFGVIEGGLGFALGCVLAIVCSAKVAGRLRKAAP